MTVSIALEARVGPGDVPSLAIATSELDPQRFRPARLPSYEPMAHSIRSAGQVSRLKTARRRSVRQSACTMPDPSIG
jgi:hypothetical protein